jgi:predicted ATP-grasp superfamily ATP-dependent carboligase
MKKHSFDVSAVVLSCKGGNQGELGLVRSLGREGVKVVFVTENRDAHSLSSRYVEKVIFVDSFRDDSQGVIDRLIEYSKSQKNKPVLFPTADPDLELVSKCRDQIEDYYHFTMPSEVIVEIFLNKSKFFEFGKEKSFPLPVTYTPQSIDDVASISSDITYPVILKPLNPKSWANPDINRIVNGKKALLIEDKEELLKRFREIMAFDGAMVVQEYIPGRDDRLYSVHVYMGKSGKPLAYFVGRKIRTYPAYAGIGCFVISDFKQDLIDISIDILSKSEYFGLALLQFKQHPETGQYSLLEINARTSSWNQLPLYCGVNLPFIAYQDVLDLPIPAQMPQRNGVKYIYFKPDYVALSEYKKTGDWTFAEWVKSYQGPKTFQVFASDDPYPFVKVFASDISAYIGNKLKNISGG